MSSDYDFKSEEKFIEWSQAINPNSYDVVAATKMLKEQKPSQLLGLDVGGGIGQFAQLLCQNLDNCKIDVIDNSRLAKDKFVKDQNCTLIDMNFFDYENDKKYDFIILKTVLHHFISDNDKSTKALQEKGLLKAKELLKDDGVLLIEENFYTGLGQTDITGRLIFEITKLKSIGGLTRKLGANTAGEGVRFRSLKSWNKMFDAAGFEVKSTVVSSDWEPNFPIWQKLPLLASGRYQALLKLTRKQAQTRHD